MAQLSCEMFLMDDDKTISGRCRLVGVQVALMDSGGNIFGGNTGTLANRTFTFKNGSGSGDTLFEFSLPVGMTFDYGSGITPFKFMFGDKRILFTDGIFVPELGGTTIVDPDPAKTQMIVFYEQG